MAPPARRATHDQVDILRAFIVLLSLEDAAAIGTTRPSLDAARGGRRNAWAHYERVVDGKLAHLPQHVLREGPRVFAALPWRTRLVLRLTCEGQPLAAVAAVVALQPGTVSVVKRQGLDAMARALWQDDGSPRYGANGKTPPAA